MKISLIEYTRNAAELLIFSKRTRLNMSADDYSSVVNMSEAEKEKELEYVFGTIGSSLEFVDFVFMIEGVTRAFTHQLVRHRIGTSFAQQSQRTVDMDGFKYLATGECEDDEEYEEGMENIQKTYSSLVAKGIKPEDARGILPTNILTNILFKLNLRSLIAIVQERTCVRVQGEFREFAHKISELAIEVFPFLKAKLRPYCVANGVCLFDNYSDCFMKKEFKFLEREVKENQSEITGEFFDKYREGV
jgi:flavin-dependent thymidylate synthase